MKIAVDAMGGDRAPEEIISGALQAATDPNLPDLEVLLVGREEAIAPLLRKSGPAGSRIRVIHAPEVVSMEDAPATVVRRKKGASMVVCGELVAAGEADAMVSAGNSGAGMAVGLFLLGRLPGIDRPAIATVLPTMTGTVVLLDAGANVDCTAEHLVQFGVMGRIYAEEVRGVANPRVGLLNIGEEACKGNELALAAYDRLQEAPLRFVGNIEGRALYAGAADVVVCDGFVGNIVLKVSEGVADALKGMVQEQLRAQPWFRAPAALLLPVLRHVRRRTDYAEYGGAPLLGVKGVCIISHGSSNGRAIANAIRVAGEAVNHGIVDKIRGQLAGDAAPVAASRR